MKKTIILLMLIASLFLVMTACSPSPNEDVGTDDPTTPTTPTTPDNPAPAVTAISENKLAVEKAVLAAVSDIQFSDLVPGKNPITKGLNEQTGITIKDGSYIAINSSTSRSSSVPVTIQISATTEDGKEVEITYQANVTLNNSKLDTIEPTNVDAKVDNAKVADITDEYVPVAMLTFKETKTIFKEIVDAYTDYFLNPNNVFPAGLEIDTEKSFITFNQTGINASIVFKSLKIDTEWHKIIVKGKNDSLEIIIDGWTSVDVGDSQPETPVFTVEENPAVKPEDNSNVVDDNTVLETANNVFSLMTGIMMNTEISQEDYQSGYIAVGTQNYNSGELPLTVVYTEQQLTYVNRFVKDIFGSGSLNSFLIHQIIPINDNNGEVKMIAKLNFAGLSFNSVEFEFIALPMEYSNDGQGSSKTDNSMDGWFESFTIDGESYKYLVDSFFKSLLKMSYAQMMISPFDAINRKDPSSDISQSDITISGNDYIFEGNALPAKGTITINKENGTFSFEDFNYYMSYTYDGSYKDVISSLISGSGTVVYNESDKISSVAFDTFSVDKIGEATDYELRNANIIIDFTFKRMSMGSY